MNKILETLNKFSTPIMIALLLLLVMAQCSTKNRVAELEETVEDNRTAEAAQQDSLQTRMEIKIELETLKSGRDAVYNNNAIVRTAKRPDDVLNQYNARIDSLQAKLD